MKILVAILVSALAVGCGTPRSPRATLREADRTLGQEVRVREFERRLAALGARVEKGAKPGEQIATVALPGRPGYFPPRTLVVVYEVTPDGMVVLQRVDLAALGRP